MRMNVRDRTMESRRPSTIFSFTEGEEGGLFETSLMYSLVVLSVFVAVGLVYEGRRYCKNKVKPPPPPAET